LAARIDRSIQKARKLTLAGKAVKITLEEVRLDQKS